MFAVKPTKKWLRIVLEMLCAVALYACDNNERLVQGNVPLFGFSTWSEPYGKVITERMKAIGAKFVGEKTYSDGSETSRLSPPIYQPMIGMQFDGGQLGQFTIDSSLWRIDNGRVSLCLMAIQHGATDSVSAFQIYDSLCDFISDSLGEPIWDDLNSSGDRFFRAKEFSFSDRAFFAGAAYMLDIPFGRDRRLIRETQPIARLWEYRDRRGIWAISCTIVSNDVEEQSEKKSYSINIAMVMKADLPMSYPNLSKRVKPYAGWVSFGGHTLNDDIYLCEWIPDSVWSYIHQYKLSPYPHVMKTQDRWRLYLISSGMDQIDYAYDISRYAPGNPDTVRERFGHFFIRCNGVVFDTSETGLDVPALYITDVTEVRYSEEGECP